MRLGFTWFFLVGYYPVFFSDLNELENTTVNIKFPHNASWVILSPIEQRIKEKIEKVGVPLKDWDIQINYGIKTGCNEAFIIDKTKRDELIKQSPNSVDIIRPILRGKDIKKYGYNFADKYLIFIPWHFPLHGNSEIKGASKEAERAFQREYPAIYNHLLQYKNQLSNRNQAETGIRYEWYALQRFGSNYWDDFSKPKIIFQEIVQEGQFMLDSKGAFFCNDTGRIITGKSIKFLIGILNSKLFFFAIKYFYGGGLLGENGVRMKHTFFENFPCIEENAQIKQLVDTVTSENIKEVSKEIDHKVYELYGLTNDEINFIEKMN